MATQLTGPVMPIRTVSFLFLEVRLTSNICQKNMIYFGWNLARISSNRVIFVSSPSSQMMTNLRNLCISLMKLLNPFSDDCVWKSNMRGKLVFPNWHKMGLCKPVEIKLAGFLDLAAAVGWEELDMLIILFVLPSGAQEGEGPGHLWGWEEIQGFRQPAHGPRQRSSFRHSCQESQGGCRAGRGEEEVKIVTMELCKIKCLKRSLWECPD